jgi:U3 small nucleolar RNA-associated protein 13
MHPNGKEVVVAMNNFLLRHYRLDPKESVRSLRGHTMPVLCMAYDTTGTLVATGSADRSVRVWDIGRGYCTHSFKEHTDIVQTVKFHRDPTRYQLFSCGEDCTLRVYDLIESACIAVFREHMSLPTSLSFSNDGYFMASVGRDQVMNFYELRGRTHVKTIPVMDEMEGVLFLNQKHSEALLAAFGTQVDHGKSKKRSREDRDSEAGSTHVVLTAGLKGFIRVLKITYNVSSRISLDNGHLFESNNKSFQI